MRKKDLCYTLEYIKIHDQQSGFAGRYVWKVEYWDQGTLMSIHTIIHCNTFEEALNLLRKMEKENR